MEERETYVQLNSDFVFFDYQFHAPAKNSTLVVRPLSSEKHIIIYYLDGNKAM